MTTETVTVPAPVEHRNDASVLYSLNSCDHKSPPLFSISQSVDRWACQTAEEGAYAQAIAAAYCTTVNEVLADISAIPITEQQLNQFCKAMKDADY